MTLLFVLLAGCLAMVIAAGVLEHVYGEEVPGWFDKLF